MARQGLDPGRELIINCRKVAPGLPLEPVPFMMLRFRNSYGFLPFASLTACWNFLRAGVAHDGFLRSGQDDDAGTVGQDHAEDRFLALVERAAEAW
jgi:hypothetical protein